MDFWFESSPEVRELAAHSVKDLEMALDMARVREAYAEQARAVSMVARLANDAQEKKSLEKK